MYTECAGVVRSSMLHALLRLALALWWNREGLHAGRSGYDGVCRYWEDGRERCRVDGASQPAVSHCANVGESDSAWASHRRRVGAWDHSAAVALPVSRS